MSSVSLFDRKRPNRILLVEDNPTSRQLLTEYLEHHGLHVLSLSKGSGFMTTLVEFQPDLVLLDLKLPDVDGYTLLQQMRQHVVGQSIPVIIVSAFAFHADQQRAIDLGARQYLVKPVNLNHLRDVIYQELQLVSSD